MQNELHLLEWQMRTLLNTYNGGRTAPEPTTASTNG
jgi:hypothetical protein